MAGALYIVTVTEDVIVTANRFVRNVGLNEGSVTGGGAVYTADVSGTVTTEPNKFKKNVPDDVKSE